jgi:hypothetical protein
MDPTKSDHDVTPQVRPFMDERHAPTPAGQKTIEAWGEAKNIWPQFAPGSSRANPDSWKFEAAKADSKWVDGQLVTEAEFDKAVAAAAALPIR